MLWSLVLPIFYTLRILFLGIFNLLLNFSKNIFYLNEKL
jgi:hypothetical protein